MMDNKNKHRRHKERQVFSKNLRKTRKQNKMQEAQERAPISGKRLVLLYWLALFFFGSAASVGVAFMVVQPNLRNDLGMSLAVPADSNCGCHSATVTAWGATGHNDTAGVVNETHSWVGTPSREITAEMFNSSCSECHTTGWVNASNDISFDAYGIECTVCHNATGEDPGPGHYEIDYSDDLCGGCHQGEHHPQNLDYAASAHANSYTDMMGSGHPSDSCLHCMTTDGALDDSLTVSTAEYAITCSRCHDPHDNTNSSQLRAATTTELCGDCHTGSRHTTYQFAIGGPHLLAGLNCTDCHGYDLDWGGDVGFNHTFEVQYPDACNQTGCHDDNVEWAIEEMEGIITTFEDMFDDFTTLYDEIDAAITASNATENKDATKIDQAVTKLAEANSLYTYVTGDGSNGFHNPMEAARSMAEAFVLANEAHVLALEAAGTPDISTDPVGTCPETLPASAPGFSLLPIFGILGLLGVALLLKKRA